MEVNKVHIVIGLRNDTLMCHNFSNQFNLIVIAF